MLPDTETETRLLKANNYNCSYAFMDACKEIDATNARLQMAEKERESLLLQVSVYEDLDKRRKAQGGKE